MIETNFRIHTQQVLITVCDRYIVAFLWRISPEVVEIMLACKLSLNCAKTRWRHLLLRYAYGLFALRDNTCCKDKGNALCEILFAVQQL